MNAMVKHPQTKTGDTLESSQPSSTPTRDNPVSQAESRAFRAGSRRIPVIRHTVPTQTVDEDSPATRMDATAALRTLRDFIGPAQLSAIATGCSGEEQQFFFDKLVDMARLIEEMPKTYEQDGKGDEAIAYLHYFRGGMDFYITEKDVDEDGEGQMQAFGLADLGYGAELGYINIQEITQAGVELDLYYTPKTLGEIKKAAEGASPAP